jgi:hypothetical protein
MQTTSFPSTVLEETIFSLSYVFAIFVKIQVDLASWVHIWVFCFVPLVVTSVLVQLTCWDFFAMTLQHSLKSGVVIPPALFFLLSIALALHGLLW